AVVRVASAHQTSVKYIDVRVDGAHLDIAFRVAPGDVTEPMGLPGDARPSVDDAVRSPAVAPYVAHWLAIVSHGAPCSAAPASAKPDEDGKLVAVTWAVACPSGDDLALDLSAFFAVDQRHIAIVRVEQPSAEPLDTIIRAGAPPLVLRAA